MFVVSLNFILTGLGQMSSSKPEFAFGIGAHMFIAFKSLIQYHTITFTTLEMSFTHRIFAFAQLKLCFMPVKTVYVS